MINGDVPHSAVPELKSRPRWKRTSSSANNFDLFITDPQVIDSEAIIDLLNRIQDEKHRGLSLSGRADSEFRRWAEHPDTPLKSDAYVLLSNWFCTQSGDRRSVVASRCEELWDQLFPCRPVRRLSSPEPGRNHVMVPQAFESFWKEVLKAQGEYHHPNGVESAGEAAVNLVQGHTSDPTAPAEQDLMNAPEFQRRPGRPLTIAEAKAGLALTFGVRPENIEITIRA